MAAAAQVDRARAAEAIAFHYDLDLEFWARWLDPSLTYSCAMWEGLEPDADLAAAQRRKLEHHARAAGAQADSHIIDVGCGWGSMLRHLVERAGVARATGLTLSPGQHGHVSSLGLPRTEVRLQNWLDFQPPAAVDGVISIGAFEHFASPDHDDDARREIYRAFFERCRDWLKPGGRLSLQTIAYGSMTRADASAFMQNSIFPHAELPTLEDIVRSADGVMEVVSIRNDRLDYARTCEAWVRRLKAARREDAAFGESEAARRYEHYLRLSAAGFRMGRIQLLRLVLSPGGWAR